MSKIAISGLCKEFFGGYCAFKNVSFSLEENTVFCVYGRAESGKTALLRVLAGLEVASSGAVMIDGVDFLAKSQKEKNVSMNFGASTLKKKSTVWQNLARPLLLRNFSPQDIQKRVAYVIDCFGLVDYADVKVAHLLPDLVQLVLIARVFVRECDIYLLDDPLCGFSKQAKEAVAKLLHKAISKISGIVVYATQDIAEVYEIADFVGIMADGTMPQNGKINEIIKYPKTLAVATLCLKNLNVCSGKLTKSNDKIKVVFENKEIDFCVKLLSNSYLENETLFTFSPESVKISKDGVYDGIILDLKNFGAYCLLEIGIGNNTILAKSNDFIFNKFDDIKFDISLDNSNLYDKNNDILIGKHNL